MNRYLTINNRKLGDGRPVYIIAEMSANHNQEFEQAVKIIKAAKEVEVDVVKLQNLPLNCDSYSILNP